MNAKIRTSTLQNVLCGLNMERAHQIPMESSGLIGCGGNAAAHVEVKQSKTSDW